MSTTEAFTTFYRDVIGANASEQIAHTLAQNGILTFESIHSKEELLSLCSKLGAIVKHRDADKDDLTRIVQRSGIQPMDGYQAFTSSHLPLHTDGSSIADPAPLLVLWCAHPAQEGGMSLFVDGKHIYRVLQREHPQVLAVLATPNSAIFLGSQTPFYGSVFNTRADGTACLRFRYDSLGYYAAPVCDVLPTFLALLNQHTISFTLGKHQGYMLQNGRWLHGRTAFCGEREMYRVLVRPDPTTQTGKHVYLGFDPRV